MGRLVVFCPSPSVPVVLVVETTVSDAERAARAVSKKTFTSTGNVTNTESKRQHASASGAGTSCSLSLVSLSPVTNENAFANRVAREVSFFPWERVLSDLFVWTVNNAPARFFCPFFSFGAPSRSPTLESNAWTSASPEFTDARFRTQSHRVSTHVVAKTSNPGWFLLAFVFVFSFVFVSSRRWISNSAVAHTVVKHRTHTKCKAYKCFDGESFFASVCTTVSRKLRITAGVGADPPSDGGREHASRHASPRRAENSTWCFKRQVANTTMFVARTGGSAMSARTARSKRDAC